MTQSDLENFAEKMQVSVSDTTEKGPRRDSNNDNEWDLKSIGESCILNPGSINDSEFSHRKVQYLEISNTGDGFIQNLEKYKIDEAPSRCKRTVSAGNTIISTVRPNREHYVFLEDPPDNLVVSTGFAVLYPEDPEQILPEYLYHVVTHPVFIDYLDANATGSAYPAVNLDIIRKGVIPTPNTSVQKEIVGKLKIFDSKIKNNVKEIKKLRELRNVMIPEVLPPEKMD